MRLICGPTSPTNPITPVNATATAVRMLTRSSTISRNLSTDRPKLFAYSSPPRSAVIFQTWRTDSGRQTAKTTATIATFSQVARAILPIVQNTICCRLLLSATNWISEISACNAKTMAMPNRITVSAVAPYMPDRAWISRMDASAPTNAQTGTI